MACITDEEVRDFVHKTLYSMPSAWWLQPASKSGKYHPGFALGEGGLHRHLAACGLIFLELSDAFMLSGEEKSLGMAAVLLHHCEPPPDFSELPVEKAARIQKAIETSNQKPGKHLVCKWLYI